MLQEIITDMGVQNRSCLGPECQYGWDFSSCREQRTCHYGLSNYYQWLCQDKPYPVIGFLGKGYGKKHIRKAICLPPSWLQAYSSLVAGLGHLKPNLLVLGYKENWQEVPIPAVEDYVSILQDAFDHNYGVCLLRMPGGLNLATQLQTQVSLHWQPRTLFCSKQAGG
ncbi:Solute carrier family 12 member 3 [Manis javanica]|nr:Solute carrier family 12 member 3 [Manis javanica]